MVYTVDTPNSVKFTENNTSRETVFRELRVSDKHVIAMTFFDRLSDASFDEILDFYHVNLGNNASVEELMIAEHISTQRKICIFSLMRGYPSLYDGTEIKPCSDIAVNPVLKDLLERLNSSIGVVADTLCIIVGSMSAIEYLDKNQHNGHCPINTFLKLKGADRVCLSIPPDHALKMIREVNDIEIETTYNLTNSPALFELFQEALSTSTYLIRVTTNKDTKQLISVASGSKAIDERATAIFSDSHYVYELGIMAESFFHAQKEGQPYTFIDYQNRRSLAYSCAKYSSPTIDVLEWKLLPIIDDKFSRKTPVTENNISKIVELLAEAIQRNSPVIFPLPKSYNEGQVMYAAVNELFQNNDASVACLNSQQFAYQGQLLVSVPMCDEKCIKDCLPNTPVLFGSIGAADDIKTVEALLENMVQVVAFTKLPMEQLPISCKPFVKQITP
ncbi:hypothetical protein VIBNISOn1_190055 [Vibrio nigripulchritudo SOn1]|uniref:Uncharacterized protein n=1 Tax=Vibrio nigripulchritudo SOn1 TaxID=1238450 RepID=A0AAV2VQ78_9VIBR|nr:hypothetical protein [Vibrio nigripulchritudo]CCO46836.1 hypothetical protein VIBNISOn1_190055 [Vibrio nigripulchritudo SOn1]